MYNKTLIECDPVSRPDAVVIKISGQYEGLGYTGMPEKRNYHLTVHGSKPGKVFIAAYELTEMKDIVALNNSKDGWYADSITTDKQSGSIQEFIEKEGKWFNYIKGTEPTDTILPSTADLSFQGLGMVSNTIIL